MLKLLLIPVLFYAALCLLLFLVQTRLLFPVSMVGAAELPGRAEPLTLKAPDGATLHGVHLPPAAERGPRTLVLGFGGNAWNAATAAAYLHDLFPEAHVVAFHYRGYPPSGGRPSAAALARDAPLVHDLAVERVRPARTIAVGFSVGSGVAAALAAERSLSGLVLVTPFDSLAAVAAGHYRWLPVRFLFRHELAAAASLAGRDVPVAILAAGEDTLIPASRTEALRRLVPNLVYDRTLAGAGHNDLYHRPDFHAAMREAMERLTG